MENIVIYMILSIFLELFYFIYEDKVKHLLIYLYGIITSENSIYYAVAFVEFFIAIGPSISAVSIVGFFIPINGVESCTVLYVFFTGIVSTIFGAIAKRKIIKGKKYECKCRTRVNHYYNANGSDCNFYNNC